MTVQKKHWLTAGIIFAPIFSLVAVILQCVSLFREFDGERGYFAESAPVRTALLAFIAVALLVFAVWAVIFRREFSPPVYTGSLTVFFSSSFMVVTLLVLAISGFLAIASAKGTVAAFLLLASIFALVSAIYFALFLHPASPINTKRGMLGIAPAFFALFMAMILYFDQSAQMNHPAKLLSLLAFLLIAVYGLGECRGLFCRQAPALQFFFTAVAMLISAVASVPNILYTLIEGRELVLSTVYDFLLFAYSLYMLARLLQMLPYDLPMTHSMVRGFLQKEEDALASEDETQEQEQEETSPTDDEELEQISVLDEIADTDPDAQ